MNPGINPGVASVCRPCMRVPSPLSGDVYIYDEESNCRTRTIAARPPPLSCGPPLLPVPAAALSCCREAHL